MIEVDWPTFMHQWPSRFRQGQHVTIIGPTGCGKTVLGAELVTCRGHVVATGIKYKDDSLTRLLKDDWIRVTDWRKRPKSAQRIVLWPKDDNVNTVQQTHKQVFGYLLQDVFKAGGWCVWSDELRYLTDIVGLRKPYVQLYVTGRSNHISLVSAAQRPSHVPLEAYSQAQHLFLFRTGDERDLARMGGLNGTDSRQVAATVASLPYHHFLYVNLTNGEQLISTVKKG